MLDELFNDALGLFERQRQKGRMHSRLRLWCQRSIFAVALG